MIGLAARVTEGLQAENARLRELLFEEQMHAAEMERCAVECAADNERLKAQLAEVGGWKDASAELPERATGNLGFSHRVEIQALALYDWSKSNYWLLVQESISPGAIIKWRPIADEGEVERESHKAPADN